ncbi:hypothetical protein [Ruania zhangjianzhongii]|uniref:hypothetical protein n=1 Tax=Ruania zhangjianzhongii TaxID=2603206 RepID=UPI0011CB642B|nr:hypothetical protein [Ruania zhangjianzhongii]
MTVLHDRAGAGSTRDEQLHDWLVESRHDISTGTVVYVCCTRCGVRRVELQESPWLPPLAISRELPQRR